MSFLERNLGGGKANPSRLGSAALVLLIPCLVVLPGVTLAASSVKVNTITFTFDQNYSTGTFVDGMPWVVEKNPGEGVRIISMTPRYSDGRHGYEVNPTTNELSKGEYGCTYSDCDLLQLDRRVADGGGSKHIFVAPPSLPRTFYAGSSILKIESYMGPGDCFNQRDGAPARTCTERSAILTVLASPPPPGSFRPPYPGNRKPLFSASKVDIGSKLPSLPEVPDQISLSDAEEVFGDGSPWIDHIHGWVGRISPRLGLRWPGKGEEMLDSGGIDRGAADYGCDLGLAINAAMLRSMQIDPPEAKKDLVYRIIQLGIDLYHASINGKTFDTRGGCVTVGRKPTILYAGYMLYPQPGSENMLYEYRGGSDEDKNTYMGVREALWGVGSDTCVDEPRGCKGGYEMTPICDGLRDAGYFSRGDYYDERCPPKKQPTLDEQRRTGKLSMTGYQYFTHARVGSAAVARILGIESAWDYPPFFMYIDRIATAPWDYYCTAHCFEYLETMHRAYGCNSTECAERREDSVPANIPPPPADISAPSAPILLE
jgi:hypothetical protein